MEGRVINVRDAHIKTAAVEIKSLKVSGKQVTMGVFRQLLIEDVIDPETADLSGIPWGLVNYFPKPCDRDTPHLHAVWQKGEELRRACVRSLPECHLRYDIDYLGSWSYPGRRERIKALVQAYQAMLLVAAVNGWKPRSYTATRYGDSSDRIKADAECLPLEQVSTLGDDKVRLDLWVDPAMARVWQERPELYAPPPRARRDQHRSPRYERNEEGELIVSYNVKVPNDYGWHDFPEVIDDLTDEELASVDKTRASLQRELEEVATEYVGHIGHLEYAHDWYAGWKMAQDEVEAAHRDLLEWEARYERHYREIRELDQLFIAV